MMESVLGVYTTNKRRGDMQVRGEASGPRSKRRRIDRQRPSKDPLIRSYHPTYLALPYLSRS